MGSEIRLSFSGELRCCCRVGWGFGTFRYLAVCGYAVILNPKPELSWTSLNHILIIIIIMIITTIILVNFFIHY